MRLILLALCVLGLLGLSAASPVEQSARQPGPRFGTSTNWAGYAVETSLSSPASGAVTDVQGGWTVPAVDCSATGGVSTYSAAWIGIDGYSSSSVEQTGTESDCLSGGTTPSYAAWYEMYPKPSYRISMAIHPGDRMWAQVHYAGNAFTLTLKDLTTGKTFSVTQKSGKAQRSSAEWVQEAPWSGGVLPLASFGAVTFTNASATLRGHAGAIDDPAWAYDRIDMANSAGATKAATGALSSGGTAFDVTWVSST